MAALAVLGGDVFVLTNRDRTTTVAVEDVVDRFRRSTTTSVPTAPAAPASTVATARSTPSTTISRSAASGPNGHSTPPAPAPRVAGFVRPKDGVYAYDTTGGETASIGGSRHDYPAVTYATVQRRAGCEWLLEQPVVKEHVDRRGFCSRSDSLFFLGQATTISFFGQRGTDESHCDPPQRVLRHGEPVGARAEYLCRSAENEMRVSVTRLRPESIQVAGRLVEVEHVLTEGAVSGRATGTSRVEQWWLPSSGLLVREVRTVTSRAHEFGGDVDYREKATFHLRSLDPRT